jgi:hypothetical protein
VAVVCCGCADLDAGIAQLRDRLVEIGDEEPDRAGRRAHAAGICNREVRAVR